MRVLVGRTFEGIEVDYDSPFKKWLGWSDCTSKMFNEKEFPTLETGRKKLTFGTLLLETVDTVPTEVIIEEMKKLGFRPATAKESLILSYTIDGGVRGGYVCLGSVGNSEGQRVVPHFSCCALEAVINLKYFDKNWPNGFEFLGVKEELG